MIKVLVVGTRLVECQGAFMSSHETGVSSINTHIQPSTCTDLGAMLIFVCGKLSCTWTSMLHHRMGGSWCMVCSFHAVRLRNKSWIIQSPTEAALLGGHIEVTFCLSSCGAKNNYSTFSSRGIDLVFFSFPVTFQHFAICSLCEVFAICMFGMCIQVIFWDI